MEKTSIWNRIDQLGEGPARLILAGCAVSLALSGAALTPPTGGMGLDLAMAAMRAVTLSACAGLGWDLWRRQTRDDADS